MRKFLIPLAAAAATFAVASPASAQYQGGYYGVPAYSAPGYGGPGYGAPAYGAPYGYAHGYNRVGASRWMQQLQQIRYQTRQLAAQGRLTRAEMRDMKRDMRSTQRAIRTYARRGINHREARIMDQRIARLHYQLARYSDWDRRRHYRSGW
jgi:hypothetical protein